MISTYYIIYFKKYSSIFFLKLTILQNVNNSEDLWHLYTQYPNTSDAPPASFNHVRPGASLQCFSPPTTDDVIDAVRRLPDKLSAADPIPTSVLKQVIDVIAPFVVALFNRSLSEGSEGHFPAVFKEAFVTPVVKKP